jgi:hypothetical protein
LDLQSKYQQTTTSGNLKDKAKNIVLCINNIA